MVFLHVTSSYTDIYNTTKLLQVANKSPISNDSIIQRCNIFQVLDEVLSQIIPSGFMLVLWLCKIILLFLPTSFFYLGNYYFPSCSGGSISLPHSFAPSLHHSFTSRQTIGNPGELPYEKARNTRRKKNWNLTPTGDLPGGCLSFIIPLKDTA